MLGEGDVVHMIVQESPCGHPFGDGVGGLKRVGQVRQEEVLAPLMGVAAGQIDRKAVGLAVVDEIATALEEAVACPVVESCVVAWIEVLTLVVLVVVAQTCGEPEVVGMPILQVEVLHHFRVFREVLRADLGIIQRIVIGESAAVCTWICERAQHLVHISVGVFRCKIWVHPNIVGESAVWAVVGLVARHGQGVAEHPFLIAVGQVHVS